MSATPSSKNKQAGLIAGLVFGIIFGFLLQKGGVGKYHILVGQLLLEDWTVVKVMLSAIVVGMLGVHTLHALGKTELSIKPTQLGANITGGLVFGAGFALSAYCPGTNMVALGQGNWDAIAVVIGLLAGSFVFAWLSKPLQRFAEKSGDQGKKTLPELVHIRRPVFIGLVALGLTVVLIAVEILSVR